MMPLLNKMLGVHVIRTRTYAAVKTASGHSTQVAGPGKHERIGTLDLTCWNS